MNVLSKQSPAVANILVVDPDPTQNQAITRSLGAHGFNVRSVLHPLEALEELRTHPVNLILSEVNLPDLNGLEFTGEIMNSQIVGTRPEVILMGGKAPLSVFECHQAGACLYVPKPLNIEQLISYVNHYKKPALLNRRRFERVSVQPEILGELSGGIKMGSQPLNPHIVVSSIGRGGFYFEIPMGEKLPKVGDKVDFDLTLSMVPDYSFKGEGVIRWVRNTMKSSGAGVEFIQIPEETEQLLDAYVKLFKVHAYVPGS